MMRVPFVIALTGLLLAGCGERAEVPPAHVGKILTSNGFQPEIVPPSKFRLPACFAYCDRLITVQTSDQGFEVEMRLFMPKDELNLSFDVRGTAAISSDERTANSIFDRVQANENGSITFDSVFDIYAIPKIRTVSRSLLSQYTISQIASNREEIGAKLQEKLAEALQGSPIKIIFADLADVQYPEVIVAAKELAKEREVAIQQEESERQIALVRAEKELDLARKDRAVRLEKAQTILEENQKVAQSVTPAYLEYRRLEVMEEMSKNGATVFFPVEMLSEPGLDFKVLQAGSEAIK